jgi:hypothetical protein
MQAGNNDWRGGSAQRLMAATPWRRKQLELSGWREAVGVRADHIEIYT